MAPVRNSPSGTTTRPPPALLHAEIARAKASVQSARAFPTAPNLVIEKSLLGKIGALMRRRILRASIQGSPAGSGSKARADEPINPETPKPAPLIKTFCRNSRRLLIQRFLLLRRSLECGDLSPLCESCDKSHSKIGAPDARPYSCFTDRRKPTTGHTLRSPCK